MGWIHDRHTRTGGSIGGRSGPHKGPLRLIVRVIRHARSLFDTDWVLMECGHEGPSYGASAPGAPAAASRTDRTRRPSASPLQHPRLICSSCRKESPDGPVPRIRHPPKRDFGPHGFWINGCRVDRGFVVVKDSINVMPGAT